MTTKKKVQYNIGLDIGNGAVKIKVSGGGKDFDFVRFPSYVADISKNQTHEGKSRVDFVKSDNEDVEKKFKGKSWVCGEDASQFDIKEQVFDNRTDGKVQLALPLLLSAIAQLELPKDDLELSIVASVHDCQVFGEGLKSALHGLHLAKINGLLTLINVNVVQVFDEGLCFRPVGDQGTTVLDLGNGTSILTRFDKGGNVLLREPPYRFGCQHLYQLIYDHPALRAIGLDRDIDLIRKGVENSDGKTIRYGFGKNAIDIATAFKECLKEWIAAHLKTVVMKAEKYQLGGDRVIVVGGGAMLPFLSDSFKKKNFVLTKNAPFANVKKLHEIACNSVKVTEIEEQATESRKPKKAITENIAA
jgi:Actin like proteins N terminal domain